jgi:hypothetical protein
MSLAHTLFGEPGGALVIPLLSAGVTVGWKILSKPSRATPGDWDVGLELLIASIVTNLIFIASPEDMFASLRLLYVAASCGALFLTALILHAVGYEAFKDEDGGVHLEVRPQGALVSSGLGTLLLVVVYLGNLYPEYVSNLPWVRSWLS